MIFKKRFVIVVISTCVGFFVSFFIFGLLTNKKSSPGVIQSASSAVRYEIPKPLPATEAPPQSAKVDIDEGVKEKVDEEGEIEAKETQVQDTEVTQKEFPPLMLKGIFYSEEGSLALINESIVKEGDTILGVKVLRISPTKVDLGLDDQKLTLRTK